MDGAQSRIWRQNESERVRQWLSRPTSCEPLPPKQETSLCLYLPLISSVLSPLNKVICTRVRASPDSVIGSPPLEPVMSYCKEPSTYMRPFTLLGFVLPSAEMKISLLHALVWPSLPRMVRKLLRQCNQLLLFFFCLQKRSPTSFQASSRSSASSASSEPKLPHFLHILAWTLLLMLLMFP